MNEIFNGIPKKENKYDPTISIILTCYNSKKADLIRALDSIRHGNNLNDLEIILIDDQSEDLSYLETIANYEEIMTIKKFQTEKDFCHKPSIAKELGRLKATGKLITFLDHDDYFGDKIFRAVAESYRKDPDVCYVGTIFQPVDNQLNVIGSFPDGEHSWTHGVFYSLDFLNKYHIHYNTEMYGSEDTYFAGIVKNLAFLVRARTLLIRMPGYHQVQDEDKKHISQSHYLCEDGIERSFSQCYYKNYLYAVCCDKIDLYEANKDYFNKEDFFTEDIKRGFYGSILTGYFYYQRFRMIYPVTYYKRNLDNTRKIIQRIQKYSDITAQECYDIATENGAEAYQKSYGSLEEIYHTHILVSDTLKDWLELVFCENIEVTEVKDEKGDYISYGRE